MKKEGIDEGLIEQILTRGVEQVYPSKGLAEKMLQGEKKLTFYLGIDPTGPSLHLGHMIPLMKLAQLQTLGHRIVMLIGDFTALIGDPTDKSATRTQLTKKEVKENMKKYVAQASKIISFSGKNKAVVKYNNSWLGKMKFSDVLGLASKMTVQQMIERDMFRRRIDEGKPIYIHEFMYPLMQGYDSVAMDVDGEIGGNDQTFNMLAGRTLLKELKGKEKIVITTKLLVDSSGKKMGKTEGNMITLTDSAQEMFGKVMSWSDEMIIPGYELCTRTPQEEIEKIKEKLRRGENPKTFKMKLAYTITEMYHGVKEADNAQTYFESTFGKKEIPDEMEHYILKGETDLFDLLVVTGLARSRNDARRSLDEGAVKIDGEKVFKNIIPGKDSFVLQKGKRYFVRVQR
jgi:tyrosyl-tRNA synthetase